MRDADCWPARYCVSRNRNRQKWIGWRRRRRWVVNKTDFTDLPDRYTESISCLSFYSASHPRLRCCMALWSRERRNHRLERKNKETNQAKSVKLKKAASRDSNYIIVEMLLNKEIPFERKAKHETAEKFMMKRSFHTKYILKNLSS